LAKGVVHRPRRRRSRALAGLFLFLWGTMAGYAFLRSGFFSLDEVIVEGAIRLEPINVRQLVAVDLGVNIWQIDTGLVRRNVAAHPMISQAEVSRKLPSKLVVRVWERQPLAAVATGHGFLEVDSNGVALRWLRGLGETDLPLITGITLQREPSPGEAVVASNLGVGLQIAMAVPAEMRWWVTEINMEKPQAIEIHSKAGSVARLGDTARLAEKMAVLAEVVVARPAEEWAKIHYIDLSIAGRPVIKYR